MLFVREFRPIDREEFSFHPFHLSAEERLQDGGDSPVGSGLRLVGWFGWLLCFLCSFLHHLIVFPFLQ